MTDKTYSERILLPIANISGVLSGGVLSWNLILPESFLGGAGFIFLWILLGALMVFLFQLIVGIIHQREKLSKTKLLLKSKGEQEKVVQDFLLDLDNGVNPFDEYVEPITRAEMDRSVKETMSSIGAFEETDLIIQGLREFQRYRFPLLAQIKSMESRIVFVELDKANLLSYPITEFIPLKDLSSIIIDENQVREINGSLKVGDTIHVLINSFDEGKKFVIVEKK